MAQPGQISGSSTDYSSASSSYSSNHASFPLHEEDNHRFHQLEFRQPGIEYPQHHYIGLSYRGNYFEFHDLSGIRDCTWYCVVLVFTFCVFVSMTLILGVYGAMRLSLGPKCSILLQPNPIFVQSIKVEQLYDTNPGLMLYGFSKPPQLDVVQTWSSTLNFSVLAGFHKAGVVSCAMESDFVYFLNEGSQINISYRVNSPSSSVFLVIAQGIEGLSQWLEDPTYPNTTLSWNVIQGSGFVQQGIFKSASYYIAVGNLNSEKIEVQLALRVRSFQYNTTEAYYKCTFSDGKCSLNIMFPNGNVAVLNSFGPEEGSESDEWNVKVSYVPRWTTYIAGIGGTTVLILAAFNFLKKFQCDREDGTRLLFGEVEAERAPLLSCKDDDLSSLGSSYDSVSNNEEDLEDFLAAGSMEGKSRDGENDNNTCRLCAICFDAPRECFFLPCGHCVACFACGTRIAEADSTCPVCSRNLKKVRKIFTV
uniref:RING-type domain-containing protein n=1 Tax=Salix viminalis TaxID=40686 RepID=A0A6N2KJ53_SALVM